MSARLPWLKLYPEIIHDPKMKRLTIDERWFWIVLLCLASENRHRGQVSLVTDTVPFTRDDYSELCGYSVTDEINGDTDPRDMVDHAIKKFISLQMITQDELGIITIKNFEKRQDSHLSDAERASRYRNSHRVTNVTLDKEKEKRKIKKKNIPPTSPKRGTVNGLVGFTEFWITYPLKKSKGQAERVWRDLAPDEQLQSRIVAAIERAKTSVAWTKDGGRYIPYPATWLRAKGWEDEHEVGVAPGESWLERKKREEREAAEKGVPHAG